MRWWQQRARTNRYHVEESYGTKMTADDVVWLWAQEHAATVTNAYRRTADGRTAYEAAFGCGYTGEVLPFAETALFKVPISHTREITSGVMMPKGDSSMVRGIWVGKHAESDDHVYLTASGVLRTSVRGTAETTNAFSALDVSLPGPDGFRDGQWHDYLVIVLGDVGGQEATVYIDGSKEAMALRGEGGLRLNDGLIVGGRQDLSPDRHFAGDLDDIRVDSGFPTPAR